VTIARVETAGHKQADADTDAESDQGCNAPISFDKVAGANEEFYAIDLVFVRGFIFADCIGDSGVGRRRPGEAIQSSKSG